MQRDTERQTFQDYHMQIKCVKLVNNDLLQNNTSPRIDHSIVDLPLFRYKVGSSTPFYVEGEEGIESYHDYPSLVIQFG